MRATLRPLLVLFAVLTVLTGLVYPLAVTAIGKLAFRETSVRQSDRAQQRGRRLIVDRAVFSRSQALLGADIRNHPDAE